MNKICSILLPMVLLATAVQAQDEVRTTSSAAQTVNLVMHNAIDISFMAGSEVGSDAVIDFRTANDFVNGVNSGDQELKVRSNKTFTVAVRCGGTQFSYSGRGEGAQGSMPEKALKLKVTKNNTGGSVRAPFSNTGYAPLSSANQDLLVDGRSGEQTFAVQYKCAPGYSLPAGTYTMNVVYTATQQ